MEIKKILLAADHAGYGLKETIKSHLTESGYSLEDLGTHSSDSVNWALYGARAAERVSADPENCMAILFCGSGIGMSIVANKFPNVRAALCHDEQAAALSRRHNNANVLALAGRILDPDLAWRIVTTFLNTEFEGGRHQQRLDYLREKVEKRFCK